MEFFYSNFVYNVLGCLVEQKFGMFYEEVVQVLVFKFVVVEDVVIVGDWCIECVVNEIVYYDDLCWFVVVDCDGSGVIGLEFYLVLYFKVMDVIVGWIVMVVDLVCFVDVM